jgi:hypothetical protein
MARPVYVATSRCNVAWSTRSLIGLSAVNGRPDATIWKLEAALRTGTAEASAPRRRSSWSRGIRRANADEVAAEETMSARD